MNAPRQTASSSVRVGVGFRVVDYILLGKPELTLLSVLTAVGSAFLAGDFRLHPLAAVHVFFGTLLVGASAGTLNQYVERDSDALMRRTSRRPIPSGRVTPAEAFVSGIALGIAGLVYLAAFTTMLATALAAITLGTYVLLYTPLKKVTPFATVIGEIPGALPPLIGWAAVRGTVNMQAWSLFFILFFWQMPHFLSLAWMYRADYARAGYRLLTVVDPGGTATSRQIVVSCVALIPAALMPTMTGLSGIVYFLIALVLSLAFLLPAIRLNRNPSAHNAHALFFWSLAYIPALFAGMVVEALFLR